MLIRNAELLGSTDLADLRCTEGRIAGIGPSLAPLPGEQVMDARGGALLPGLHDHHMHLFALAATRNSVDCGPPEVRSLTELAEALGRSPGRGWLRGIGYHESVAGSLDRFALDQLELHRPLKIQHRSGKLWMLNSTAVDLYALEKHRELPGVECDAAGKPTGRLFRMDSWMRHQPAARSAVGFPDLGPVSAMLAARGVTGITDTSPDNGPEELAGFEAAMAAGELLQSVRVMGNEQLPLSNNARLRRGERKILLDDDALPAWTELEQLIAAAHSADRSVAIHCVTPAELVLSLSVLGAVGSRPGDRIEHASLVPESLLPLLAESAVRVVTQPGFIAQRGEQYRQDVPAGELDDLYRCRTLLDLGIPLAGSTDAPYGEADPWAAMHAAVHRRTEDGAVIGEAERLTPEEALALFTGAAEAPGVEQRRLAVGAVADLCLLDRSWPEARQRLSGDDVRATISAGQMIYCRDDHSESRRRYA